MGQLDMSDGASNSVTLDDILKKLGEFGLFQKQRFILFCLTFCYVPWSMIATVFLSDTPPYACNWPNNSNNDYYNYNFTGNISGDSDVCAYTSNGSVVSCPQFVYDTSYLGKTVVSEFNLVCDSKFIIRISQSLYMLGCIIGSIVLGVLADIMGRKFTFVCSALCLLVSGIAAAFSTHIAMFVLFRVLVGIFLNGVINTCFVMAVEMFPPKQRTFAGTCIEVMWAFGSISLALVGFLIRDWRYLQIAVTLPALLFAAIYYLLVPESPRWLVTKGYKERYTRVLKQMAFVNKVDLNETEIEKLKWSTSNETTYSVLDLLRTPLLRFRISITSYLWFVAVLFYYGIVYNVTSLVGDKYTNFFIQGVIELPASLLALLACYRYGRRIPLMTMLFFAGVCLLIVEVIPDGFPGVSITFYMLAKSGISGVFICVPLYSAEVLPTVMRNLGFGYNVMWGRIGGVLTPLVLLLKDSWAPLPGVILGVSAIVGALSIIPLPETHNVALPETVDEAANYLSSHNGSDAKSSLKMNLEHNQET